MFIKDVETSNHSPEPLSNQELLSLGIRGSLPSTEFKPIHHLFQEFANLTPQAMALTCGNVSYTYEFLNAWANEIAHDLLIKGTKPGSHVAVMLDPSAVMVAVVLGILKCGASYIPLDKTQPVHRILSILSDASVSAIFTHETLADKLVDLNVPIFTPNQKPNVASTPESSTAPSLPSVSLQDIAYLVYTSGSTGEPKGVLIGHRELAVSTLARRMVYPGKHTFLMVSPLFCDSSAAGLWGTLSSGGHLIVASYEESRNPEALLQLITNHRVTKLLCIPSLYAALLEVIGKASAASGLFLDTVVVAGEPLSQSLINKHFALLGRAVELVNEYGPTEATIWATYHRFSLPEPVSIGGPIPGTSLYVLDDNLHLTPLGEIGELFIGGGQLARGYFGRPDASHQAFIPDPFSPEPNARMYKTGDLVRWNREGSLEFIGRKDRQVKIRGHRVELGAIESTLHAYPEVREAVVLADKDLTSLVAFIILSTKCSQEALRQKLSLELPSHMVPSKIYLLDKFPLMSSGKVDREVLSNFENDIPPSSFQKEDNTGRDMVEKVSAAWRELLNLDNVPPDINFFDLGGHSLMVFKLQDVLEKHTGKRLPVVSLFRHTTVSDQAVFIENDTNNTLSSSPSSSEIAA